MLLHSRNLTASLPLKMDDSKDDPASEFGTAYLFWELFVTLPKFNSSPLKIGRFTQKEAGSSSNHHFSGAMLINFCAEVPKPIFFFSKKKTSIQSQIHHLTLKFLRKHHRTRRPEPPKIPAFLEPENQKTRVLWSPLLGLEIS